MVLVLVNTTTTEVPRVLNIDVAWWTATHIARSEVSAPLPEPPPDHRSTAVDDGQQRRTTVDHCQITVGPPLNHRSTTGQWWLTASQRSDQTVATAAKWHATSACRSHVSQCGNATSADWVPLAYVAATIV
ncbi:hypothetical protein Tco_0972152 [Tanacetum coccineum]